MTGRRPTTYFTGQGSGMDHTKAERPSGSYALVTVHDRDKRVEVMQAVTVFEQVINTSAVDGDYDIVMLIKELPGVGIDEFVKSRIETLQGIKGVEICHVELTVDVAKSDNSDGKSGNSSGSSAQSYLFLETDKRHFEDVFSSLSVLSSVSSCEVASGQYSLVLRLEAGSFNTITKIVNENIRPLPGVLRAKESRIIKLTGF